LVKTWTARNRARLAIVFIAILLLIVFAGAAGRVLVVDSPQPSDLILVLAGETDRRPARALELLKLRYGRRVLIDVPADAKVYEFSQIELAEKYVHNLPNGDSISLCPIHGLSTRDESHDAEKCIDSQNGARILIVTSDFHTRRALSIFRHEVRGKAFSVAAAHDSRQFGTNWWTHRQWAKTCTDEWLRMLWWNAVERWQ
jgi:hypothetical protein